VADLYQWPGYELAPHERVLRSGGKPVPLGARAFDLLVALVERQGQVLAKDDLLGRVWPGVVVEENNLTVQVSALRKLLGPDAIATVPGRGYQFTVPVRAGAAATGTGAGAQPPLALPDKPSVAVLPFANLSGDAADDALCDGTTEDLTMELARFHSLFVIARNSSFTYKGRAVDVQAVGSALGVRYIVQGSIRRAGDRVRVAAHLVEAATGTQLWGERYDRVLQDLFVLQEEVTRAIVAALAPQIEVSEYARLRLRPDPGAYARGVQAWALARNAVSNEEPQVREEAVRLAREALRIDPRSTLAIKALALMHFTRIYYGTSTSPAQDLQEAMRHADAAAALDTADHDVYLWRGVTRFMAGEFEPALLDVRRARELNPNDAHVAGWLGFLEGLSGAGEAGVVHAQEALRLSPLDPQRYLLLNLLCWPLFAARRYIECVEVARRAAAERPEFAPAYMCMAICLAALGELQDARAAFDHAQRLAPGLVAARLAGQSLGSDPEYRERSTRLLRVAAGLA
jgi:TolB-like protein/Flp pilus assembly protein TadD